MSKSNNSRKFTAVAAFGAVAIFSMLSFGGSAEAAINLSSCMGSTAGKAASCCEVLTAAQRPLWMIQSRTNCHEAVVCDGAATSGGKRCHIKIRHADRENGDDGEVPSEKGQGRGNRR